MLHGSNIILDVLLILLLLPNLVIVVSGRLGVDGLHVEQSKDDGFRGCQQAGMGKEEESHAKWQSINKRAPGLEF